MHFENLRYLVSLIILSFEFDCNGHTGFST